MAHGFAFFGSSCGNSAMSRAVRARHKARRQGQIPQAEIWVADGAPDPSPPARTSPAAAAGVKRFATRHQLPAGSGQRGMDIVRAGAITTLDVPV